MCSGVLFPKPGVCRNLVRAEKGIIDLSGWHVAEKNRVSLDGQWLFYWKRLLPPDRFSKPADVYLPQRFVHYFNMPGLWNELKVGDTTLSGDGYATFVLYIRNIPDDLSDLYIKVPEIPTAFTLWGNGKRLSQCGKVGTRKKTMKPWLGTAFVKIAPKDNRLTLVLHVSNFYHKDGGVWHSFEIGTADAFAQKAHYLVVMDSLLFGCLIIMGLYQIALFVLRRQDQAPLYFGLFCLLLGVRSILVGYRVAYLILPNVSWPLLQRIEFICLYLSAPAFCLYVVTLFPEEISPLLWKTILGLSVLDSLLVMVLPVAVFATTSDVFQLAAFISGLYIMYALVTVCRRKRTGCMIFLSGFLVLFVFMIHDILYTHLIIHTSNLIHFGVFIFIFLQAFLLSKKYSVAFEALNTMRSELESKNAELIKMDKLKDEFLSNTSHELRTPLNGIIGIAEAMLDATAGNVPDKAVAHEAQTNLAMIASSGRRLYTLINDLLDFSRMKQGNVKLAFSTVDMKSLSDLVIKFTLPLVKGKNVTLRRAIGTDARFVIGDENRLQQILFNLVGNAVKFTLKGTVTITTQENNGRIRISVSDTGMGIDEKDYDRIFNAFEQVDGSDSRVFQGTGIGLAVSQKLALLHDTRIEVESEKHVGSEFFFHLNPGKYEPLTETESQEQPGFDFIPGVAAGNIAGQYVPEMQQPVINQVLDRPERFIDKKTMPMAPDPGEESKRILVVDDEPINRQILKSVLKKNGYEVITAQNGFEALDMLRDCGETEKPDLILLDIMMPGMNGLDVCSKIRNTDNLYALPVIFLSAKNYLQDLVAGFQSGGNDYVTKPFHKEELLARIHTHLQACESVKRLKKNTLLKEEIQRRKKIEAELITSKRKLARIVDCSEDAILVFDSDAMITFFNKGAEQFFGCSTNEIIDQPLEMIVTDTTIQCIMPHFSSQVDLKKDMEIEIKCLGEGVTVANRNCMKKSTAYLSWFSVHSADTHHRYCTMILKSNAHADDTLRVKAIENAFANMHDYIHKSGRPIMADLRKTSPDLDTISDMLPPETVDDRLRTALVEIMNEALHCWERITGMTKIELAEKSGIWKAYLDKGTWKTRTLDKYLSISTLPKKPRWREVMRTANYVLATHESSVNVPNGAMEKLQQLVHNTETLLTLR